MIDLEDLSPADLDAEACEAVGIAPLGWFWEGRGPDDKGMLERWRADTAKMLPSAELEPIELRYPPVSTEPAACAKLKAAASKIAGWPFVLQNPADSNRRYGAWIQQEPPVVDETPMEADGEPWLSLGLPVAAAVSLADTEERAVALAVVAWTRAGKP